MSANDRSETEIRSDIAVWQTAKTNAAQGKSITIVTSAGTRVVSAQDVSDIEATLQTLYRELSACLQGTTDKQGQHDFALANFNNEAQR